MSANPTNANLSLTELDLPKAAPDLHAPQFLPEARVSAPGHEALQALLAFSSLHEQIRQRRSRELRLGVGLNPDVWELEQFVLDEVLQLVAERALAITGADGIAIALAEEDAIICRASAGTIAPDAGVRLDPSSGFSGACLRREEIVRCDDAENDPRVNVHACRALGARSMVAVPLSGRQSVIGLLEAFSTESYGFNDSDVRSLNLLAELILSALKPEEEDRLAEISQQVVGRNTPPSEAAETKSTKSKDTAPETRAQTPAASILEEPRSATIPTKSHPPDDSRPGLMVVLLMVIVALALGGVVWWNIQHTVQPVSVSVPETPTPVAGVQPVAPPQESEQQATASSETPVANQNDPASAIREKLAVLPQVTGIRHWSSAASSTVAIDLKDQIQYEAHRLSKPERIYFDLHDTALAPGLFGRTIEVGDALLVRIRIAQPMPGVTRVVLETKGGSNFSVSLESNPYRLLVEVRRPGTTQPSAKINLFTPNLSAQPNKQLSSSNQELSNRHTAPVPVAALKFRLALDAGHGGWDLGTVGRKGLMEKDLVLDIVERLGKLVENGLDAEVIYTRSDDNYVALEKRAEIANLSRADLFVSIHANYSASSSARGVETYYTNTYSSLHARTREIDSDPATAQNVSWTNVDIREKVQESRRVASRVQRELYDMLRANHSGIRDRGVKEAQYVVLTGTSMPAILAEVSFVSSPADENNLQSSNYRQQIAEALYKGIVRYATESGRVKLASTSGKPTGR